jgi:ArsR family transcriptional regulator, zinc-responsive transcriptional repressor
MSQESDLSAGAFDAPDEAALWENAAETLRVLAHPLRLRMLMSMNRAVRTVSSLAKECGLQNHQASEHLRLMQRLGLVKSHRQGRFTYYRLDNDHIRPLLELLSQWFSSDVDTT